MAELRCGRSLTIPNFYVGRRGVEKVVCTPAACIGFLEGRGQPKGGREGDGAVPTQGGPATGSSV
jgi:hypothetical protein